MSKTKNNGGAAFPRPAGQTTQGFSRPQDGMTLRDYFAAKAMQIIMTADDVNSGEVAGMSYAMADAMLKERDK